MTLVIRLIDRLIAGRPHSRRPWDVMTGTAETTPTRHELAASAADQNALSQSLCCVTIENMRQCWHRKWRKTISGLFVCFVLFNLARRRSCFAVSVIRSQHKTNYWVLSRVYTRQHVARQHVAFNMLLVAGNMLLQATCCRQQNCCKGMHVAVKM